MCQVSDKIQLCTCAGNADKLTHWWTFYRYSRSKDEMIIGQVMLPFYSDPETEKFNQKVLTRVLNDGTAFDVDLHPVDRDRLVISVRLKKDTYTTADYGFEYRDGRWKPESFDPLEWEWHHNIEKTGKLKNPLKRKKNNP